jgi:hypothetical protein
MKLEGETDNLAAQPVRALTSLPAPVRSSSLAGAHSPPWTQGRSSTPCAVYGSGPAHGPAPRAGAASPTPSASDRAPIPFRSAMISVWGAMALIGGKKPEEVIQLIEDGELAYAFDLALVPNSPKREIRILCASINDYLAGVRQQEDSQEGFDLAMRSVFPSARPTISAADLAQAWNASPWHILNLYRANAIRLMKGSKPRRGPTGSPLVEVASAVAFLRARRVL